MKNIHNCNITVSENLLSRALYAHFKFDGCDGCLIAATNPWFDIMRNSWSQKFRCRCCGHELTGTLFIDEETD